MPCEPIAIPELPTPPSGISLTPPIPTPPIPSVPNVCCIQPPFTLPKLPLSLPPDVINAGSMASILATLALVAEYRAKIPLSCPRQ